MDRSCVWIYRYCFRYLRRQLYKIPATPFFLLLLLPNHLFSLTSKNFLLAMKIGIVTSVLALVANAAASKVVVGYFPNWLYAKYPVSQIPFSKYTHINYAFAILNDATYQPSFTDPQAVQTQMPQLVTAAHNAKVKVLLSIGGWTGCQKFSSMVASPANRKTFINWNINFTKTYNTDGIDIDWEYPGQQGAGCNEISLSSDTDNFATLLSELRTALDTSFPKGSKEISLANRVFPFAIPSGPSTDVSKFVPSVDRFNLMTYDINGAWANTTGPNSPLNYETGKGMQASFVQAIHDWNAAGVPYSKMAGGLAFYGRAIQADGSMDGSTQYADSKIGAPQGDSDDAFWQDPSCSADPGGLSGIWKYANLRSQGLLTSPTTAGNGWTRYWDKTSQTPWLFNPSSKIFISYDDPTSIAIKVNYALCKDLAGVMIWDIHQDNGELLDAVQGINGSPSSCGSTPPPPTTSTKKSPSSSSKTTSAKPTKTKTTTTSPKTTSSKKTTSPSTKSSPSSTPTGSAACTSSNNGQTVCAPSGTGYLECVNGSWLSLQCGTGTVCKPSGNSIVCG